MVFPDKKTQKKFKIGIEALIAIAIVCAIIFFVLANLASRGAARIFNREMEKQDMLRGTITVETLTAHINGDVSFENLVWREPDGNLILQVPEGSFHVRPWDVITRNFKSTTIQELTLKNALVSVRFDENMQVDFLRQPPKNPAKARNKNPKRVKKGKDKGAAVIAKKRLNNFNRKGRKLRVKIILDNCKLGAHYRQRHYVLNNVNMEMKLNTAALSHIELSTGKFGGTMYGGGITISGNIDFKPAIPNAMLDVAFREVDPSSLGFGMNIHDAMTVVAKIEGPVTGPKGRGTVRMKELHIPALNFTDVIGDVTYSDSIFRFSDVHAKVFNGTLVARGDYHLDTRVYNIYGNATKLDSRIALNDFKFACLVDMNLTVRCDGNPRNILVYGDFKSGKGHYRIIPFDSLQGRFTNQYKELNIYDAVIVTPVGTVSTDALSIIRGKLHLGKIVLQDPDTGQTVTVQEEKSGRKEDRNDNQTDRKENKKNKKSGKKNSTETKKDGNSTGSAA